MKNIIELPVCELKTALAGLGKVVNRRSALPVLAHLRVSRDATGQVALQGTDLDSTATYKLAVSQPGEPVAFLVPLEPLLKTIKTAKDRLGLYPEGKDAVVIQTFVGNTPLEERLGTLEAKEWPALPEVSQPAATLDQTFRDTMRQAAECASTDESRYVLNSVFLDVRDPGAHYVVATNGRALYSANSFHFGLAASLMLPTRKFLAWGGWWPEGTVEVALKPAEKAKTNKEVDQPGWIKLTNARWDFVTKQIEGEYPNWKQVIPESAARTVVHIAPEAVARVLELLARLPGDYEPNYPVTLQAAHGTLALAGRNKDQKEPTALPIVEASVEGEPVRICFNRHYLAQALRFGLTEFHIIDDLTPMLAKAGGKRMVIMPLKPEAAAAAPAETPNPTPAAAPPSAPPALTPTEPTQPNQRNPVITTPEPTAATAAARPTRSAAEPQEKAPALKAILDQVESAKTALRGVLGQLTEIATLVKAAEKEQRLSEKEFDSVRTTLRSLQKVSL